MRIFRALLKQLPQPAVFKVAVSRASLYKSLVVSGNPNLKTNSKVAEVFGRKFVLGSECKKHLFFIAKKSRVLTNHPWSSVNNCTGAHNLYIRNMQILEGASQNHYVV